MSRAARAGFLPLSRGWPRASSPATACFWPTAPLSFAWIPPMDSAIQTTVADGGELGEHKGINAPGVPLPASAVTPKDVSDLRAGLALGVDFVALSFVQTAADLRQARALMADAGRADVPLVAKIERPRPSIASTTSSNRATASWWRAATSGSRCRSNVCRACRRTSPAARVAAPFRSSSPRRCSISMRTESRPTRAEVSDAANAVDDGVDAIMLAGETAAGAFPARAVQTLAAIINEAESGMRDQWPVSGSGPGNDPTQAICEAAVTLANRSDARAIVAVTRGGGTARRLSALRPHAPIVAACDREETARRLSLYWGVWPVHTTIGEDVAAAAHWSARILWIAACCREARRSYWSASTPT